MNSKVLLEEALHLKPAERLQLIEQLAQSLDKPDTDIEQIWANESEKRYKALTEGKVKSTPLDEIIQRYK